MYNTSENKKSIYSKNVIKNALFNLMKKEKFVNITILQICQEAEVSRPSFYRNFTVKEDIIEYAIQDKISTFVQNISNKELMMFEDSTFIILWTNEKDFFQTLYSQGLFSLFTTQLTKFMRKNILDNKANPDLYDEYLASLISYSTTALLIAWVERGCQESPEDFEKIIKRTRQNFLLKTINL